MRYIQFRIDQRLCLRDDKEPKYDQLRLNGNGKSGTAATAAKNRAGIVVESRVSGGISCIGNVWVVLVPIQYTIGAWQASHPEQV